MKKNRYVEFVLTHNIYMYYCAWRKYFYYYSYVNNCNDLYDNIPIDILPYMSFYYYVKKYPRLCAICEKLYASNRAKVRRVHKRIVGMLYTDDGEINDCLFVTLTFSDEVLDMTSQKTRRVYVARFLKSQFKDYVANIDFGDVNSREHYHAIIGAGHIDLSKWYYDMHSRINVQHIRSNSKKIAEYINKLTYHSVKDTAGFLIYSRSKSCHIG